MALAIDQLSAPLNNLLASLPLHEFEQFKACLVRVSFVRGQVLIEHNQPVDYAYFIERGVVLLLSEPSEEEESIQVAMVGREGLVGDLSLVDMRHAACGHVRVHTPGEALRISKDNLRQAIGRSPALRAACANFVHSLITQVMQTAACNARRNLTERCARWLVMMHERVEGDEVWVTHEALSAMLGMHRPGVTVAASALQQAGLIRTGRSRFTVLNRAGLHDVARGGTPAARTLPLRTNASAAKRCIQASTSEGCFEPDFT